MMMKCHEGTEIDVKEVWQYTAGKKEMPFWVGRICQDVNDEGQILFSLDHISTDGGPTEGVIDDGDYVIQGVDVKGWVKYNVMPKEEFERANRCEPVDIDACVQKHHKIKFGLREYEFLWRELNKHCGHVRMSAERSVDCVITHFFYLIVDAIKAVKGWDDEEDFRASWFVYDVMKNNLASFVDDFTDLDYRR